MNQSANTKRKPLRLPVWGWAGLGAAIVGIVAGIFYTLPSHGSWRYGACKVFLESSSRFPVSIKIIGARETDSAVSIAYSDMNPYGSEQIRDFKCYYSTDPRGRLSLSKITIYDGMKDGPVPLPDDVTKRYSAMLPALSTLKPDTTLPGDLPSGLADLKQ